MREFFRGWKRKAGCVTLMMACVFAAGWVRSLFIRDIVRVPVGNQMGEGFESIDQSLVWSHFNDKVPLAWYTIDSSTKELRAIYRSTVAGQIVPIQRLAVPYWFTVLPFTLLSAYLLFSKPRRRPKQPVSHA